jgi:hypothetical protein
MQQKMSWAYLPASIRHQAAGRWGVAGPGDGFVYHWIREDPPADYCGPLPFGRLLRRSR